MSKLTIDTGMFRSAHNKNRERRLIRYLLHPEGSTDIRYKDSWFKILDSTYKESEEALHEAFKQRKVQPGNWYVREDESGTKTRLGGGNG